MKKIEQKQQKLKSKKMKQQNHCKLILELGLHTFKIR